jgi:hypothetical protein
MFHSDHSPLNFELPIRIYWQRYGTKKEEREGEGELDKHSNSATTGTLFRYGHGFILINLL